MHWCGVSAFSEALACGYDTGKRKNYTSLKWVTYVEHICTAAHSLSLVYFRGRFLHFALLVKLTLLLATSCTPRAAAEEFKFSFNPVNYSEPATGFQLKAK